jgi:mono/diheme cytochrome c family protein
MKTLFKVLGALVALGVVAVAGFLGFMSARKADQRPPSDEKVQATPERLARGKYLVEHVSNCLHCHSDLQFNLFATPILPGTEGQGGTTFTKANAGVPGEVSARNLTPDLETGKGSWTDGELIRAIREGVDREGQAMFPMMPYKFFRSMSDEDVRSVVAFLRTLKPIKRSVPPRRLDFPVNLFVKMAPKPVDGPIATPDDAKDHLAYGKYVTTMAGCMECHTAHDERGQLLEGQEFGGGWRLMLPDGQPVIPPNITPHPATYIGMADKEAFIGRFKAFATTAPQPAPKGRNTLMPWYAYSGMTEKDLGAIYDYLKTQKPIDRQIDPFPGAIAGK